MAENTKSVFPIIPISHWFNLREQFKRTIPTAISPNYIASTLEMTEDSARSNIIPTLKTVGLISSDDGKVNQDLAKEFRSDDRYPEFCKKVIKGVYPTELSEAFPDADSDRKKIQNWFLNHTNVGEVASRKMASFYLTLLEGNPNKQSQPVKEVKKSNVSTDSKGTKPRSAKSKKDASVSSATEETTPPATGKAGNNLPSLNINIQVHLSSDLSIEQIEQVFASMAKHLYKQG